MGYVGKVLLVDLSRNKIWYEPLPGEDILEKLVGGKGLGLWYLYRVLMRYENLSPFDPRNPLIFMTGPLTGLPVPSGNNTTAVSINADTRYTTAASHSHGYFGPYLKMAGFDGIIILGASKDPVYLWVHDEEAELRDASKLWGKDTHETEDLVKKELGLDPAKVSVASIGPAGENMCTGAGIWNDKHHSFSHSGVGAVMGSKKLKAIAVHGNGKIPVKDPERLNEIARRWSENLWKSDVVNALAKAGLPRSEYTYTKQNYLVSDKNFSDVSSPEFAKGMSKFKYTPKPCYACPIACSYEVEVTEGPYKGTIATPAGGGENLEGVSSLLGIYEPGAIFHLIELADKLGFETSTIGSTIALLIEAYLKGRISKDVLEGFELRWGDPKLVEELLIKAARKEGFIGYLLSLGPKRAAEAIGAEDLAVHVKGTGINLHDWRVTWGILLGQLIGGGYSWPAPAVDAWATEPDIGYPTYQDPFDWRLKPKAVRDTQLKKNWVDSIGICWFADWGVPGALIFEAEAVEAATGIKFTKEKALEVGERVVNLERILNVKLGLKPDDDINDVGPRFLEPPIAGPGKGRDVRRHIKWMIKEYYRLMGWNEKTGMPYEETLERIGLKKLLQETTPLYT
jgi:aldehyde:ferredoxin oxidoreductase